MKRVLAVIGLLTLMLSACGGGGSDGSKATYKPARPTGLTVKEIDDTNVTIEWIDNADNESGYIIERFENSGEYTVHKTVDANTTEYLETLPDDTIYSYRVRAFNKAGDSFNSNETAVKRPKAASVVITAALGGIINLASLATVTFPAGAIESDKTVEAIEGVKEASVPEEKAPYLDLVADIKVLKVVDFTQSDITLKKSVDLVIQYSPEMLTQYNAEVEAKYADLLVRSAGAITQADIDKTKISVSDLDIYYFNAIQLKWIKTSAVFNAVANTFTFQAPYLGIYCLGYNLSAKTGVSIEADPELQQHMINTIDEPVDEYDTETGEILSRSVECASASCRSASSRVLDLPIYSRCSVCPKPFNGVSEIDGVDLGCNNCSFPGYLLDIASGFAFKAACAAHDCCYNHGRATYGRMQTKCDNVFLGDELRGCVKRYPAVVYRVIKIFGRKVGFGSFNPLFILRIPCNVFAAINYTAVSLLPYDGFVVTYAQQPCFDYKNYGVDCSIPRLNEIEANKITIEEGETVNLTSNISNPDSRPITYTWSAAGGSIANTSAQNTTWTSPGIASDAEFTITLNIADGSNTIAPAAKKIKVLKPYTITYNANGSTGGTPPAPVGHNYYGYAITPAANTGTLVKTDFYFAGWNTQAGGSGFDRPAGSFFIMAAAPLTLYAKWVSNPVAYSGNGNTGGAVPVDATAYAIGNTVTVKGNTNGLVKNTPYLAFTGWNTAADGSGTNYLPDDTFILTTANIILYAVYEVNAVHRGMASVPAGTFNQKRTSGTPDNFNHTVSAFKIGKYEVTYELWYTVYQWAVAHSYYFANAGREGNDGTIGAAPTTAKYEPVSQINWRDAAVWCNAYSELMGLTPVYYTNAGFTAVLKDSRDGSYGASVNTTAGSFDNPYVKWTANGYRLPTEGEWQYAASYKDGTSYTPYNYGSGGTGAYTGVNATDYPLFNPIAWYGNSTVSPNGNTNTTKPAGEKLANALGIYDMSGNVYEWCYDWYGNWPGASADYRGLTSGSYRVIRGGSWFSDASYLRVGNVFIIFPYYELIDIGFRFVRAE